MLKIGALVSGGGTNLQAVIDGLESGEIKNAELVTVISSREDAYALVRAEKHGVDHTIIRKKDFQTDEDYQRAMVAYLKERKVDLVLMAGFMVVAGPIFIKAFENRIMNIHPSLIPSFCGVGYYGLRVHEAVLKKGVKVTGATVHFVTEETDAGPIILQKAVSVEQNDTPESLQKRVLEEAEWKIYPEAVRLFCEHRLEIVNGIVKIRG